ncbi:MAG: hypothetical protein ACD_60C00160G0018 [uncultured bacterium]|nr:MAG: hypothetical protein ACD_60C00160G0018 [uncultured bacterium]
MDNPVLNQGPLPIFSSILPIEIEPALKKLIEQNRAELSHLLNQPSFTWDNLIAPLLAMDNTLNKMWSPIAHLHSIMESEDLRAAYNTCLPLLTEYHSDLMQNTKLYEAIKSIAESPEYQTLDDAKQKVIQNELRDFRLAGVNLSESDKIRFTELQKQLSTLSTTFAEHVLDATDAWSLHITDLAQLKGIPEQTLQIASDQAKKQGKSGWLFTLDHPSYYALIKYLENRELRQCIYEAHVTRASLEGPHKNRFDNTPIMESILKIRLELANLLGFKTFADYSLATKMARDPEEVLTFLNDLVVQSKPFAEREIQELSAFAKSITPHLTQLEAWDIAYYTEKLREKKYALSEENLRPYFPIHKVLNGMFSVVQRLFGIHIIEHADVDTWHKDVKFFEVQDHHQKTRGFFYIDLYARPHKRDGAWMDECRIRQILLDKNLQHPVAFLTCNFTQPVLDKPAFLTHDDVQTIFHEFGHCLHHLLTKVDYAPVSGMNGVPWDAVEFPSQFLEHWCWDKETLFLISEHEMTGEPLPDSLYQKLLAARHFQAGMHMLRQLEFAIFDFRLHVEFDPKKEGQIQSILDDVRQNVAVITPPSFNRFQNSFSHIFAGGYAAGYYSYKWAEVLSSDAFSLFEEEGIFNAKTGKAFLQHILEAGGVYHPMDLFVAFRGRKPHIDALLRHVGLV